MPFFISKTYAAIPMFMSDMYIPNQEQLRAYIQWLERELTTARALLAPEQTPVAPPEGDTAALPAGTRTEAAAAARTKRSERAKRAAATRRANREMAAKEKVS